MSKFIEQLESREYFSTTSLSNPAYLTILPTESVVSSQLNNGHKSQLYLIRVDRPGEIDLRLEGLTGDASLSLISDKNHNNRLDNGEVIAKSDHILAANETIRKIATAGIYQILVTQVNSNTLINYTLRFSTAAFTTPDQVDQTGNDVAHARDFSIQKGTNRTVNEYVGANDSADVFKMVVTETTKYDFRLSGLVKNADMTITEANGNALATTTGRAMSAKTISGRLEAGTYYITVTAVDAPTPYALTATGTAYRSTDADLTTRRVSASIFSSKPITASIVSSK